MILDETRERFLLAIAKQVDPARVAEIHFFAPIRQAGVESGVAVIAATRVVEAQAVDTPEQLVSAGGDPSEASLPQDDNSASPPQDDNSASLPHDDNVALASEDDVTAAAPQTDDTALPPEDGSADQSDDVPAAPIERHVIYTARYRLTLKGPDRGKWETNVTAEADAPIITVDAVVRGVQRRAGDVDDATRMDGEEVRAVLAPRLQTR